MNLKKLTSTKEKIDFLQDILSLTDNGHSIIDVLNEYVEYGKGFEKNIAISMLENTANGGLAEGMRGWFSDIDIQTLSLCERSEDFENGLRLVLQSLIKEKEISGKFSGALFWPLIQVVLTLAGLSFVATSSLPEMEKMIPKNKWPDLTVWIYDFGFYLKDNWLILSFVTFVLIPPIIIFTLQNLSGSIRSTLDSFPIFRQYRLMMISKTFSSLHVLLKSGEGIKDSMHMIINGMPKYVCWHIEQWIENIETSKESANLGNFVNTGFLDDRQQKRLNRIGSVDAYDKIAERITIDHLHVIDKESTMLSNVLSLFAKATMYTLLFLTIGSIFSLALSMSNI